MPDFVVCEFLCCKCCWCGAVPLMNLIHHDSLPIILLIYLPGFQPCFALTRVPTNTQHQMCSTLSSPYLQGPSKPLATPFGQVNSFRLDHVLAGPHVVDFCKGVDCRCANACAAKVARLMGGMLIIVIIFDYIHQIPTLCNGRG